MWRPALRSPRCSFELCCQSRRPVSLARFLPGLRYAKGWCQVFPICQVFLAVEGTHQGKSPLALEFPPASDWLCPGCGSHCQSISGGLSAPQPPLVLPSAGGVEWMVALVSVAWQRRRLRSHTPSPPTWGPRRRPPLGRRRSVGEGGRGAPPSQGGREEGTWANRPSGSTCSERRGSQAAAPGEPGRPLQRRTLRPVRHLRTPGAPPDPDRRCAAQGLGQDAPASSCPASSARATVASPLRRAPTAGAPYRDRPRPRGAAASCQAGTRPASCPFPDPEAVRPRPGPKDA